MAVAPLAQLRTMPVATSMTHQLKTPSRASIAQRRSTLKRSADELDFMDSFSSPSKRSRVTFDADIDILSADDDDGPDPQVIREQVRRAIQRRLLRDDEEYDKLRVIFLGRSDKQNGLTSKILKLYLQALLANVSIITRDCSGLVHAMLDSDWIGRDDVYFMLFVRFLGNLAAAQGGYVGRIMATMVTLLGPQKTRRIPGCKPVKEARIHSRALQTCQFITQLVPTASASLADNVAAKLDFDFARPDDRITYVRSVMDLIKYVPELTSDILTNVMRQLIKLDTTIQADLDEEDDDIEEDILQHMTTSQTLAMAASQSILQHDLSDDDEATTSEESDMEDEEDDVDPAELRRKQLNDGVRQVDMMMDILFQYYTRLTTSSALQNQHQAVEQLNAQFLNLILPTYRSRHPQFLIFHFAQSDPIIVDKFIASCVSVLVDTKQPPMHRHAAAAYFSGLVGRGRHVPPATVSDCLYLLCDTLNMMRPKYEHRCSTGPDLRRFGDFYSTFQAIMYIFCMRWRDIASVTSDIEDDEDYGFQNDANAEEYHFPERVKEAIHSAIYSPLNPLRICTPAIVDQFAKLTHYLKLLYIFPKIEENKRVRIFLPRHAASDSRSAQVERDSLWVGENGMLEGFFPYDPYHLPISKHWIENDYLPWQGLPGDEEDSDLDEEDVEDEVENVQSDGTDDTL